MSAKIYSDQRGGCKCGGKFTAQGELDGMLYPKCDSCDKSPGLFRIRAQVITDDLVVKYIDIRHDKNGKRLMRAHNCLSVLERVNEEIAKGAFDYRDYDSLDGRAAYQFEVFIEKYLVFHENRLKAGKLSPAAFANKKTAINHLKKAFPGKDISTFKRADLENFGNKMIETPRARDLALAELKAILNHAKDIQEMISKVPKFDLVPASRKRKEVISLETAHKIISAVKDEQYRTMLKLLTIYPVRPGELRALQWRDIYAGNVYFRRHFSRDVIIGGRKSIKDGDKSEVDFPLVATLKEYMDSIPRPLNQDAFIFTGKKQAFVSDHCLSRAWRDATKFLKLPKCDLYEMRHARLTQMAEQSKGDAMKILKASGHTNLKTVSERYLRSSSDLSEFFH